MTTLHQPTTLHLVMQQVTIPYTFPEYCQCKEGLEGRTSLTLAAMGKTLGVAPPHKSKISKSKNPKSISPKPSKRHSDLHSIWSYDTQNETALGAVGNCVPLDHPLFFRSGTYRALRYNSLSEAQSNRSFIILDYTPPCLLMYFAQIDWFPTNMHYIDSHSEWIHTHIHSIHTNF